MDNETQLVAQGIGQAVAKGLLDLLERVREGLPAMSRANAHEVCLHAVESAASVQRNLHSVQG